MIDRNRMQKNTSRMQPGRKMTKSMSIRRSVLSFVKDKFKGLEHPHTNEKARRRRQIEGGILKAENGLVMS